MHLIRLGKLGILCALLVGCGIEGLGQREVQIPAGVPPALLHDVVFEGFSSGIRDAVVTAAVARIDTERRVALLREVEISFREELRDRLDSEAEVGFGRFLAHEAHACRDQATRGEIRNRGVRVHDRTPKEPGE